MSHLDTVVQLQSALAELWDAEQRLAGIPDWMRELHDEHCARRAEIDALEDAAAEATLRRREHETAIQDTQERLQRYQGQVSMVRTQREYAALLQEIDATKAQLRTLEEEVFADLEEVERLDKELDDLRAGFGDLDERYSTELAKWEAEKPDVQRQVTAAQQSVEQLRATLPRPVLALFDRLVAHRNGEALAPLRRVVTSSGSEIWHCGACNYQVRLHAVVAVRSRGELLQCDGCKRIFCDRGDLD